MLGRPGIYHYAEPHDHAPSRQYGFGQQVDALCHRGRGIVYAEDGIRNIFPSDRLCFFCETAAARG